jgi:hypothetical protein
MADEDFIVMFSCLPFLWGMIAMQRKGSQPFMQLGFPFVMQDD